MNTTKKDVAKLIKDTRLLKGYSQQQLADLAQLNLRSVQRIENAEVLPRSSNLKRLAAQLDLDEGLLLAREDLTIPVGHVGFKPGNSPIKLILTVAIGLLIGLLTAAFLSQSAHFPETNFELFIFLAVALCGYVGILWLIWRNPHR